MTENDKETRIDAQPVESVDAAEKSKGGRRPASFYAIPVNSIINLTAPRAARILESFIKRERGFKTLPAGLQKACEYVIDHAIGKARMKPDLAGGHMSYKELMDSADTLDDKPRPILADVEEIANKTAACPGDSV